MTDYSVHNKFDGSLVKSNDTGGGGVLTNGFKLLTPPQSPTEIEILNQQEIIIEEVKTNGTSFPLRPNRPYSYYVATNFHPFENTPIVAKEQTEQQEQEQAKINQTVDTATTTTTETATNNKKKMNKKSKNRLSVSLTDIKKSNSKLNTINSVNVNGDQIKQFASQNCILNQNTNLNVNETTHHKVKTNRLNRLFRRIFHFNRKIKSSSPLSSSTTPITMLNQPEIQNESHIIQHINYDKTPNKSSNIDDESKFSRFFTSFRSMNGYYRKNNNNTPIVATSTAIAEPTTTLTSIATIDMTPVIPKVDSNTSQNLPHISLSKVNTSAESTKSQDETFYSEVSDKLKQITFDNSKNDSNDSIINNNDNIPFIDDDYDESDFTINESFKSLNQTNNEIRLLSSTHNNNNNIKICLSY